MAKQPETRLQERVRQRLKAVYGGWWFKVWGGPFQKAGIPDVIGCCEGLFFALECKRGRNQLEPIQSETIARIKKDGKGIAAEIRSVEDALNVVRQGLAEAGRLPAERGKSRPRAKDSRRSVRSGNWEDICRWRSDRKAMEYVLGVITPHVLRAIDRPIVKQDDNMAKVSERTSSTDKSVRRTRPLRKTLRSQGIIASRRSVRKVKR